VFTYYLKESYKTQKAIRKENEKSMRKEEKPVSFPGWDAVEAERRQEDPRIWLTVRDQEGQVIRRVPGQNEKGFNRVAWDLKYPSPNAVRSESDIESSRGAGMVAPGSYTVTLSKEIDGVVTELSSPQTFQVERLYEGALPAADPQVVATFWRQVEELNRSTSAARRVLSDALDRVSLLQKLLLRTQSAPGDLEQGLHDVRQALLQLEEELEGDQSKSKVGEEGPLTLSSMGWSLGSAMDNTYGPTSTQRRSLEIATEELRTHRGRLEQLVNTEIPRLEQALRDAGAPWIEGEPLPEY
jgi:hypothetical protein